MENMYPNGRALLLTVVNFWSYPFNKTRDYTLNKSHVYLNLFYHIYKWKSGF